MWTEAHRARHDARLKEIVSLNAVGQIARWLERADPPRSGRATPYGAVVRAIAWHLRIGGPWRAALADRVDGLFTKDKFCLTRQGVLALSWRCSPRGADRQTPKAGAAVPRGSCPLGVGHEATALDGGAGPSQPPGSRAAVGPGLPAASVNARRGSGRPRGRHSDRHIGGESPCR
jgi:hypothetical protein